MQPLAEEVEHFAMRYDLSLIYELCNDVGLHCTRATSELSIHLAPGATLLFQNTEREEDCLMGFVGTPWHAHDNLVCSDRQGNCIDLSYLDVVEGVAEGVILICELWVNEKLSDRWLVHRDYVDEFRYLQRGDEIRIRPAPALAKGSTPPLE